MGVSNARVMVARAKRAARAVPVSADAPPTGDDALRHRVAAHRAHERVRRPGHRALPTTRLGDGAIGKTYRTRGSLGDHPHKSGRLDTRA